MQEQQKLTNNPITKQTKSQNIVQNIIKEMCIDIKLKNQIETIKLK